MGLFSAYSLLIVLEIVYGQVSGLILFYFGLRGLVYLFFFSYVFVELSCLDGVRCRGVCVLFLRAVVLQCSFGGYWIGSWVFYVWCFGLVFDGGGS